MTPTLSPGDRLLVDHRRTPRVGDVVTAEFADGTLVVKRATEAVDVRGEPGWFLRSDNPDAPHVVDSRHRGPVRAGAVRGVVRLRIWPRPRVLRRRV
jgi:phage repressor protein C with HTH and peptisase S24 domain